MLAHAHALHGAAPSSSKTAKRAAATAASSALTGGAAARKSGDAIDVDLGTYSAYDPFAALATLRKVLVGLTHSHLVMRLDHHRLALHLLGLIEPFVTLVPARNTLAQQPNETLDRIAFYIPAQRDLLALALCSKRMHSVVFPRHLPYRAIHCKLSNRAVWEHFVAHPSLALNVRRLEIMPECAMDKEIVPPELPQSAEPGQKASSEVLVRAAIENMTGLNSLRWLPDDAPPFVVHFPAIWPALRLFPALKEVDVFSNSVFVEDETVAPVDEAAESATSDFASIGAVTMRSTCITEPDFAPSLRLVTQLLADHCANLEIIKIGYGSELGQNVLDADMFFERGRWPKLRTLHLLNVRGTAGTGLLASAFFDAHPTIEVLHLQVGGTATIVPNAGALPALRELRASKDQAAAILGTECDEPRPLETLKGPFLTGRGADDALLRALTTCKNTLRRVELRGVSGIKVLRALASAAPRLTWLDVAEGRDACDVVPTPAVTPATSAQWADALALFPGLTTFHGACFFAEVAFVGGGVPVLADKQTARRNDDVAALLASRCPKLRRLDHWLRGTNRVVVLAREEDRVRWVVMRTREEDGVLKWKGSRAKKQC